MTLAAELQALAVSFDAASRCAGRRSTCCRRTRGRARRSPVGGAAGQRETGAAAAGRTVRGARGAEASWREAGCAVLRVKGAAIAYDAAVRGAEGT
ncbi:hypothetical protein BE20_07025 [Sorangium cellulosum]|nr:hypothetical protein BE20_07025 [Sorangium cellulosum]